MTGIAFGWIGATTAFGSVVRNANTAIALLKPIVYTPHLDAKTDQAREVVDLLTAGKIGEAKAKMATRQILAAADAPAGTAPTPEAPPASGK